LLRLVRAAVARGDRQSRSLRDHFAGGFVLSLVAHGRDRDGKLVILKLLFQPAVRAVLAVCVFHVPSLGARAAVLLGALRSASGRLRSPSSTDWGVISGAILRSHLLSLVTVSLIVDYIG
jgi:hypothetical protein